MTEAKWLASEDPAAMMWWLGPPYPAGVSGTGGGRPYAFKMTDRKLRLIHEAWKSPLCGDERHTLGAWTDGKPINDCLATLANITQRNQPMAAAILRDVVGNPFRPIVFRVTQPDRYICTGCGNVRYVPASEPGFGPCEACETWFWRQTDERDEWLTPTVLSLAEAAHEEQAGRKCQKCGGSGYDYDGNDVPYHDPSPKCKACKGTGRIEDGSLDPHRLLVLADALEEAGCTEEALLRHLLRHLRGEEWMPREKCRYCNGSGIDHEKLNRSHVKYMIPPRCSRCSGGEVANTGGWRPLNGPHVRGCWALSLLLNQE